MQIALLGDIMLGRGLAEAHLAGGWEESLAYLAPQIKAADLALANLESPLTRDVSLVPAAWENPQDYNLCASTEGVAALQAAGIDLLGLANNHSLDCSPLGVEESAAILAGEGLQALLPGGVVQIKQNGLRISFVALEDVSSPLDEGRLKETLKAAADEAELLVVSVHWGAEYQAGPTPRQEVLAQLLADAGADLILGHHPHVLQRVEWLQGQDNPNPTLVVYSLGNALFDQPSPPDVTRSALLLVELGPQGVRGVEALPFVIYPRAGVIGPAAEADSEKILRRLKLD